MHDVKKLPASPGLARRLLAFSQLNHMNFTGDLVDLAMKDLLTPGDFEAFPYSIDAGQLSTVQYVKDWEGRAMLLSGKSGRARHVALAHAWLSGGRTLIMTRPEFYADWAKWVKNIWPDSNLSVFGNPRYQEKAPAFPEGVVFSEKPDFTADIFITSYGGLIWHNFFNHTTVDQTIVEELDHQGAVNYKWEDALKGIFNEVPRPLFIQNINNLPNDSGRDNMTSLQSYGSKALQFLGKQITDYMWAGTSNMGGVVSGANLREAEDYLTGRGYTGVDNLRILSLFGVSSHLLDDVEGHKAPIMFWDNSVRDILGDRQKRASSGLLRLPDRERAVEQETGIKIDQVVRSAVAGDRPSQTLVGSLMTPQWANLKARHLKHVHGNLATRMSRCLFLTSHHELKRALQLQFGLQMEDLAQVSDRTYAQIRFIHPSISMSMSYDQLYNFRPLSNLIVTLDDLIAEPKLLQVSNYLFLAEPIIDRDYMDAIKEAAEASGTRLVTSVTRSIFEEFLFRELR